MTSYKTQTRAWLAEAFTIFLYIAMNLIIFLFIEIFANIAPVPQIANDTIISFNLFYTLTSIMFIYFPTFLIGSLIYKFTRNYLLSFNKSKIIQFCIVILFMIMPFYLWALISRYLGIYQSASFNPVILPFYSFIFNEIIPVLLTAFILGTGIVYLYKINWTSISASQQKRPQRIAIIIGISLFTGYLLFENFFYLIVGTYFLDNFTSTLGALLLTISLIGCLIVLVYEIISNWASPHSLWGKPLEKYLGTVLYPVFFGFILVAISLAFSVVIINSSSIIEIPDYLIKGNFFSLSTNPLILKFLFILSFIGGLLVGVKRVKNS